MLLCLQQQSFDLSAHPVSLKFSPGPYTFWHNQFSPALPLIAATWPQWVCQIFFYLNNCPVDFPVFSWSYVQYFFSWCFKVCNEIFLFVSILTYRMSDTTNFHQCFRCSLVSSLSKSVQTKPAWIASILFQVTSHSWSLLWSPEEIHGYCSV